MLDTNQKTYLTQEAYDRLHAELTDLMENGRRETSARIEAAREEGDLKENGGYQAAKEDQGKMEARIRQLDSLLADAEVGEVKPDDGVVEPGMVVTVRMFDAETKFLLGSREIGEGTDLEVYSEKSPLGAAINGRSRGESVSYVAPSGSTVAVDILDAVPYRG